jgi:tetratricopeptide (TPR) repeat protein
MTRRTKKNRRLLRTFAVASVIFLPGLIHRTALAETLAETGILAAIPKSEAPLVTEIRKALLNDQFASARGNIASLFKEDTTSGQAQYWAGLLCLRTGQPEKAIRYLRASQKLANNAYTEEALALAYYSVNQFKLFADTMTQASRELPDNFAPYYYLGRYYLSVDVADFQQAEALLSKAIKIDPENARAVYYLAYCQESEGSRDSAESSYHLVLQLSSPGSGYYALAKLGTARISKSTNRKAEALADAESAAKALPGDKDAHILLAELLTDTGDNARALLEWKTAQSLDPTSTRATYGLLRLYVKTGDKAQAKEALEQLRFLSKLYGSD